MLQTDALLAVISRVILLVVAPGDNSKCRRIFTFYGCQMLPFLLNTAEGFIKKAVKRVSA